MNEEPILEYLSLTVPLRILEIQCSGLENLPTLPAFTDLQFHWDATAFGGSVGGKVAFRELAYLSECLARQAFAPGGTRFMGMKFEARRRNG